MSNHQYTSDLKRDVLFRAGEPTTGKSDFDTQALEYINRAYLTLAMGGLEFNEDIQEDWWWLRKDPPGVLVLQAPYETGTVAVTNDSTTITFSSPPTFSAEGWHLRIRDTSTVFRVITHTASAASATLDSVYTNVTDAAAAFTLFKLTYPLAGDVLRVAAPMRGFADSLFEVDGVEARALDREWPLALAGKGVPTKFAHVTESKIRFNKYGIDTDGNLLRVEYDYLLRPPVLTNAANEEPLVPLQFRHIIADIALFMLLLVKDDNRDIKLAEIAKRGIRAMSFENKHKMTAYSSTFGKILPRQQNVNRRIRHSG